MICYHYDVKIKPDSPPVRPPSSTSREVDSDFLRSPSQTPPRLNREIFSYLSDVLKVFGNVAVCYDGRGMAYAVRFFSSTFLLPPSTDLMTTSSRSGSPAMKDRGTSFFPTKKEERGRGTSTSPFVPISPSSFLDHFLTFSPSQIKFTRPIDLNRLTVFVKGDLAGTPNAPDASEVQSAIQAVRRTSPAPFFPFLPFLLPKYILTQLSGS